MQISENTLSGEVIGAAIEVHRQLGSGLLESVYEACLIHELSLRGVQVDAQVSLPVHYKGLVLDSALIVDLIVGEEIIVEIKCVQTFHPSHDAQLLTYMNMYGAKLGLLINFHSLRLVDGVRRLRL